MSEAPASPFLPGTKIQYAWDSTSLGYLKQCPRLYQYIMIDGWGSTDESVHLRFGIELHQALQDFEKELAAGIRREDAIHDVVRELLIRTAEWKVDEESKAGKYKNRRSLVRTVIDYLDHYHNDAAKTYIMADGKPAVELSFSFELDWGPKHRAWVDDSDPHKAMAEVVSEPQPYLLCGHLDSVVNFNDELFVMDHKTTTSTPGSYYFDQFTPNNQMTLYTLAAGVVMGASVKGVIIDGIQVAIGFSRMVRGMTFRTPDQLEEWLNDLKWWLAQAELYATQNYWPMNDTSCDKFGGCRYREICSKSPAVRENFLRSHFEQLPEESRWNPLSVRG